MATSLTSPAAVLVADNAIIAARKELALSALFTTDFSKDAVKPGTTLKVGVFTNGAAAAFNASNANYETTQGSVGWASVTFGHYLHTFQFDDADFLLADGTNFWQNAAKASGNALALKINALLGAEMAQNKFTNDSAHVTMGSVTKKAIAGLRADCATIGIAPKNSVLLLEPGYFADVLSLLDANVYGGASAIKDGVIPGLFGFKAVAEFSDFPTESTATKGVVIPEDALVIAGRVMPVNSPAVYEEVGTTTDEISGLTLGVRRHGNAATGANFMSVEAVLGAKLAQPTKGLYITAS